MATDKFDLQLDTEQDNVFYENSLILPILLTLLQQIPQLCIFCQTLSTETYFLLNCLLSHRNAITSNSMAYWTNLCVVSHNLCVVCSPKFIFRNPLFAWSLLNKFLVAFLFIYQSILQLCKNLSIKYSFYLYLSLYF